MKLTSPELVKRCYDAGIRVEVTVEYMRSVAIKSTDVSI